MFPQPGRGYSRALPFIFAALVFSFVYFLTPHPDVHPPETPQGPETDREEQGRPTQEKDGISEKPSNVVPYPNSPAKPTGKKPERPPLQPYDGPVEHIFFHPLIVYPELAFDGDLMAKGYDDWFVTVEEFRRILFALYERGYMLVQMEQLVETKMADGKPRFSKKTLNLPPGKKPLVLSIDDLNYYDYMRKNGNAHRLVLDGEGRTAAYAVSPEGKEIVSRSIEIVPIVDQFVEEHPDFSLDGAKGIIALTGYQGILGYRTNDKDSPEWEKNKEEAAKVVRRLKDTGWSFASHGYGHLDAAKVTPQRLKEDTMQWKEEVESLIGPTPVYIFPFGSGVFPGSEKFSLLQEAGFALFCGVGPRPYLDMGENYMWMDRRHIDGVAFRYQKERLKPLFDVEQVVDPRRPGFASFQKDDP